jgi:2-polyprenyl-6-methoxyphenol hydroxylase-like FAD-dependent oxidoreductase
MRKEQTDVLVVGAGPVGLTCALLLAEAGVNVQIIDREPRTAARSYACALHPATLKLLDRLGLASTLVTQGRRVESIGFYEGKDRRAELNLGKVGGEFPFLLIVPQNELEGQLEQRLAERGVRVNWNHRFDDLQQGSDEVNLVLEKLGGTSTGYIVPHWETVVQDRFQLAARFVVGCDGHNSLVRHRLGIESTRLAGPEFFAAYEFEAQTPASDEVKVVLDAESTNVLWPLVGNRHRWTFQMIKSELSSEFPEKERRAVRIQQSNVDQNIRAYVERIAHRRAPWFSTEIKEIIWCTDVVFEHRIVKSFGKGRVWLAGDAAHQTGPVGAQSMNVGMLEVDSLAAMLKQFLQEDASFTSLEAYNQERLAEWSGLLGMAKGLRAEASTPAWIAERSSRLLSCIPGSGPALEKLATQLSLKFAK